MFVVLGLFISMLPKDFQDFEGESDGVGIVDVPMALSQIVQKGPQLGMLVHQA
jgi:hypothetical protein